jgi:hypothetical protein
VLDDELHGLLADPLRGTRKRYLPAGRYTIEVAAGGQTSKTTLRVRPPREPRSGGA